MNKQQLIDTVAAQTGQTKHAVETILTAATAEIKKQVKRGDDVKLVGFGTFTKSKRKARMGRNPITGKSIKIPSKFYPKFRAGSEFREVLA